MDQETSLNLGEFDPLTSPSRAGRPLDSTEGTYAPPEAPFANPLFQSTTRAPEEARAATGHVYEGDISLLIDISPSPSPSSAKPYRNSSSSSSNRNSLAVPTYSSSSLVRKSSPLKASFSFFEDSFDESTTRGALPAPFALSGAPPSAALYRLEEETENLSVPPTSLGRAKGKKWGIVGRMKEEKSRRRSRSLSPVKDWSPIKEGNSSMVLSAHQLEAGDLSLIADEGGSFLANGGHSGDMTLDAVALPNIGEEGEEGTEENGSEGVSQLLRGLGESTTAKPPPRRLLSKMPTSQSVPALSSILPASLTASTRPPLSRSLSQSVSLAVASLPPVPPIDAEVDPTATSDASLLLPPNAYLLADQSLLASTSEPSFLLPGFRRPTAFAEPSFFLDTTPTLNTDAGEEGGASGMSFLNASTASFKEYRDSPVKPRVVSVQAEKWAEEKDGRTPRPAHISMGSLFDVSGGDSGEDDGTSGSSFDFAGCKTGDYSTLFHQAPPPAALKPESTATLLIGLQTPLRPSAMSIFPSSPASTSPVEEQRDLLACSTRTVVPEALSPVTKPNPSSPGEVSFYQSLPPTASSTSSALNVPEGDLLGIGDVAPSPPRAAAVEPILARQKATSGADRMKRRLEELRADRQKLEDHAALAKTAASTTSTPHQRRSVPASRDSHTTETPAAPHPFAKSRPSTVVKPQKTLKPSRSSISLASGNGGSGASATKSARPDGRLARPRGSLLPSSSSVSSLPSSAASSRPSTPPPPSGRAGSLLLEGLKTPGERKESTRARLERLREEKRAREAVGQEKKAVPATVAGSVLVRRKSIASLGGTRVGGRASLVPSAGARPSLARASSITPSTSSSSTTRTSSRPSLAPAANRPRASEAASSSSSSAIAPSVGLKRPPGTIPASTRIQFSSVPLPRARAPLKAMQPPSTTGPSSTSAEAGRAAKAPSFRTAGPSSKARTSMIGLGMPAVAAGRK
ncbi:hypothetical protein JCM11251_005138 [Rhodosporidiobolus azoricus]